MSSCTALPSSVGVTPDADFLSRPAPLQAVAEEPHPDSSPGRTAQATSTSGLVGAPQSASAVVPDVLLPNATTDPSTRLTNPLTGLPAANPALLDRRPMAIKISNYPRDIRPQFGLNAADVVFEYYIEWLHTRFIAVFYGNDARQIGPVRSGRYFDEHITRMYQAYYVFNYADPREYTYFLGSDLRNYMVVPGFGKCPPYFQYDASSRISDSRHYETYFDSTRFGGCLARKGADNSRQELMGGYFRNQPPTEAPVVERIYTHYSRCDYNYWQYDAGLARYLRFQETSPSTDPRYLNNCQDDPETYAPLTDALTRNQVAADNIVIVFVPHTFSSQNEEDDEIYHIDLVDSGRAYVFRDGFGEPARWFRPDIDQPLQITTPVSNPLPLKPGRVFYQVIGQTSDTWSDGHHWHFDFHTP
jgi:hypothetical protein